MYKLTWTLKPMWGGWYLVWVLTALRSSQLWLSSKTGEWRPEAPQQIHCALLHGGLQLCGVLHLEHNCRQKYCNSKAIKVPYPHWFISDIHFLSQCLEDGLWSPVEVSCMFDSSSLVFSDWPAITISILCIIIIILVIIVCWAKGYTTCKPPTKPCFISKGVNASTIAHSVIDTDLIKSAMTSANYNPPLSTFHRCNIWCLFQLNLKSLIFSSGSVVGIRYPKENYSGKQQQSYPEPETKEEKSKSAAGIIRNQFEEIGRSSSERSSGDGEESLYATIR